MTQLKLYITRTIKDSNGKMVKQYRKRPCRSFVKAFLQLLEIAMAHAYNVASDAINITDTGNTARSVNFDTGLMKTTIYAEAPANNSNYGTQIGTGTTAPATTDYAMETKIAHGAGAGQMQYGACSVQSAGVSGANMEMNIVRAFVNNSGGVITVKEVGLVVGHTTYYFLALRDAVDDAVNNGQTYTVTYTFETTV